MTFRPDNRDFMMHAAFVLIAALCIVVFGTLSESNADDTTFDLFAPPAVQTAGPGFDLFAPPSAVGSTAFDLFAQPAEKKPDAKPELTVWYWSGDKRHCAFCKLWEENRHRLPGVRWIDGRTDPLTKDKFANTAEVPVFRLQKPRGGWGRLDGFTNPETFAASVRHYGYQLTVLPKSNPKSP